MYGLIFMTWEKYLSDRFGQSFLDTYREHIGETVSDLPLANRLYEDAPLLAGVGAACQMSGLPADTLLHEYGHYFIINGLTRHLCSYILSNVHSGRDLVLSMRDAHARLRHTLDGLKPPLFEYRYTSHPNEVVLIYDSERKLCSVLKGAIEGAAERYGETVHIYEHCCMNLEAPVCRIEARFVAPANESERYKKDPVQLVRQEHQKQLMELLWSQLPEADVEDGVTLKDLQKRLLHDKSNAARHLRPAVLLEGLYQLQFAGYVMSMAHKVDDELAHRQYWRVRMHL